MRKLALAARLVGGGSWRRTLTLREPTAEPARLRAALGPKLAELPAPIVALRLELVELAESTGQQLELVRPEGDELRGRLSEGLRQVRASPGGRRLHRRRGRAVVASAGAASAARSARRLNAADGRRSSRRTSTARRARSTAGGRARPGGVARRRPLVDGGAGQPPLLRRRPRGRRARGRLPRRGAGALVQPARDVRGSAVRAQALEEASRQVAWRLRTGSACRPRAANPWTEPGAAATNVPGPATRGSSPTRNSTSPSST